MSTPSHVMQRPRRRGALAALTAVAALLLPAVDGGAATAAATPPPPAALAPSLAARLARGPAALPVIVTLRAQVPGHAYAGRPTGLIRSLRHTASHGLPPSLAGRGLRVQRLWLLNALALRARPAQIALLARDPAVARIDEDRRIRLLGAEGAADSHAPPALFGRGDWGLAGIGAPEVWRDYGLDGAGVRVGVIDTGVDATHPDLLGKVVAWRDFVHHRPDPYDDQGHGTHVTGTILGGATGGAPIGVAPGARAVVAKALDADGAARVSTLIEAAQWMTDPDGDPATADYPTVINASWGTPGGPESEALRPLIRRWHELGIVPVFAAGNFGPGRDSIGVPAAYPETLAVGALGPGGDVPSFSSRGRVDAEEAGGGDSATGPSVLKPDLVAPGQQVLSGVPGGGWVSWAGTSMAAPHVTGAVALLRQADPGRSVDDIEDVLRRTARDVGTAGPDPDSGAGLVDVRAAVAAVRGPAAPRPGLEVIASASSMTRQAALTYAVATGGAPVGAWLDGAPITDPGPGPLVRVPVPSPGRHTVQLAALAPDGAPLSPPRSFSVTVDRTRPALRLTIRRTGLLAIDYRASAGDTVAGVAVGSVRSRASDGGAKRGPAAGHHAFTGPGPYWIEVEAADRAGNVARLRRRVRWPAAPLARRLAWTQAFATLSMPFLDVHLRRELNGRYDPSPWLVEFLAANLPYTHFVALRHRWDDPPRGAIGVYSDARHCLQVAIVIASRRYYIDDLAGRVRRGASGGSSR